MPAGGSPGDPEGMPEGGSSSQVTGASPASALRASLEASDTTVLAGADGLADGLLAPGGEISPSGVAEGVERTEAGLRQQFGYRSELLFGQGYTEAAPVMAYETFVLDNTDILLHLGEGILAGTEAGERMVHIANVMNGEEEDGEVDALIERCHRDQDDCPEGRAFFADLVLPAIKKKTGRDIRHVLWLCDCPEDVMDAYGSIEDITEEDIDEHEVGTVLLSDNDQDGKLWGYEHEIERPDLDMWW